MEFLTSIVGAIGGEIAKYTLVPLGRHIGYLIFYNGNIKNLEKVLKKLNERKITVDQLVDAAERNLRIPAPETKTWQQNVGVLNGQVEKFLEEIKRNRKCLNDLCPNPKSRYSVSRKATKMRQQILVLLDEADKYSQTDLPARPPALGSTFNTEDTKEFESRNLIMNNILEALKDDSLSMIGICGQGGVGKTTMMKKIVQFVERHRLFDEIAKADVSQNPDVKRIQGDIASCLGLIFHDENEQERAQKLHERIIVKCEKKILLILDDIWTEMDFQELGVPSAGKRARFKILLTSRREDECQKMGSLMNFRVDPLSNEEGWNLFKGIAFSGISIDNLHQLAKQIADECDGLPLVIVTIAKALKGRDVRIWADTLNQLQSSNLKGISGMEKVYSRLELSYNLLQREEAKACFLLCGLFPEDYAIPVEDLVRYAVGLRLLDNAETILQARDRVYALIGELKDSFLLLDVNKDENEHVKMHDVVRDVAISIATREKSYLVSCDNTMNHWPKKWQDRYNDCAAISLFSKEIKECPTDLECPKLQLLQLRSCGSLPDNFFEGMKELKVVDLNGCFPPKSLNVIKKVRTLHLSHMESGSTVGDSKKVEILKIGIDSHLTKLPDGVGLMENLRLLDMRDLFSLRYIPAGVLSKLSKLEELYASLQYVKWESRVDEERVNASLTELESQHMTTLEICVSNISQLPKRHILELLVRFMIFVGSHTSVSNKPGNALNLTGDGNEIIRSGICALLKRVEYLELESVQNLKNDMYELGDDGFPQLKTLQMSRCGGIQRLADGKKIKDGCFKMLREISINSCNNLEYMFPTIMTTRLSRSLQKLSILRCDNMEVIFNGKEDSDVIEFPNLNEILLSELPNLKALWMNKSNDHQEVKSNSMELPNYTLFPSAWIVTSNLKVLKLMHCRSLKVVFSTSVAAKLTHLHMLQIHDCEQVKFIVGGQDGNTNKTLLFPMLTEVSLEQLPELVSFCAQSHIFLDWSSLEDIEVYNCPKIRCLIGATQSPSTLDQEQILFKIPTEFKEMLKVKKLCVNECANVTHLFTSVVAKLLVKLKNIVISRSCNMEQVIAKEEGEEANGITRIIQFSELKSIKLIALVNMRCFYGGIYAMEFPLLEFLEFKYCSSIKTFSYGSSLSTPKLKRIRADYTDIYQGIDLNRTIREEILAKLHLCNVGHLVRVSLHHLSNEEMSEIRQINIKRCENLLNVIPCNLIARLQKVELLDVKQCDLVEEIFEYGTGVSIDNGNVAISSHLQHIILGNLKNLKYVFNKIPATVIVFPNLKVLSIDRCKSLKNIFWVSMVRGLLQLEQLQISRCDDLEEIVATENEEEKAVTHNIVLPKLCSVDVSSAYKLKCFYGGTRALELPSLTSLKLNDQSKMESFSNGLVSTPQLTQVQINHKDYRHSGDLNEELKNEKFEKVEIGCIEDFMKICQATEYLRIIKDLSISNCHSLLNAIPYNLVGGFRKLEKLVVERCDSMEEIFEYDETSVAVMSGIEEISLKFLNKLKHIFNKNPRSVLSFQKLRKLDVFRCDNLKNIFSFSSIRDLVKLEELKITNCDGLEQIVAKEDEEEGISNRILFPQLRRIDISYFSEGSFRLECFYSGIYALEFPLLESVSFDRCYSMTTFSTGSLTTPLLQQLQINQNHYPCTGDLNQDLKNKMLEIVDIEKDEHFARICRIAEQGTSRIRDLSISDLDKLFNIAIPCSVIQNLEKLNVQSCNSVETIFEFDKQTTFSTLEKISLGQLRNLKHIFNKIPKEFVGFQQLTSLMVGYCHRLENVFQVTMLRCLPQLQLLEIYNCGMEKIIAEEESMSEKIVLPQLKSISVSYSDKLICFYNGISDIEFPLLQSLSIDRCYQMKTFSHGSVTTPKLQNLQIHSDDYPCNGNLNAYIREIWDNSRETMAGKVVLTETYNIEDMIT